jgi:hypothetical protein
MLGRVLRAMRRATRAAVAKAICARSAAVVTLPTPKNGRDAGRTGKSGGGDRRDRGTVSGGGSGAPDRDPFGDDDDIVARRLRRAAEQETDPELKEKLWKEYIEYKKNSKGGG